MQCAFVLRICQILSVFGVVLLQIPFGSGAARVRIRNDFSRILLLKVSDPTGSVSGSLTLPVMITVTKLFWNALSVDPLI